MNLLTRIFKDNLEICNGRIRVMPACWVFSFTEAQAKRTQGSNPRLYEACKGPYRGEDASGRKMYLIKQRAVRCQNPEVGKSEDYVEYKEGGWCLPVTICRKCEYYRKRDQDRLGYPHCDWLRKQKGGTKGALQSTAKIVDEAVDTAREIIHGSKSGSNSMAKIRV